MAKQGDRSKACTESQIASWTAPAERSGGGAFEYS